MDTFENKLNNALNDVDALQTPECLDSFTIGLYAEHKLAGEAKMHAEEHLKACLYCLDRLAEMRELLFYQARKTAAPPQLIGKLKALLPQPESQYSFISRIKELLTPQAQSFKYAAVSLVSIGLTILVTLLVLKPEGDGLNPPTVDLNAFVAVRALSSDGQTLKETQGVVIKADGLVASNLTPLAGASVIEVRLRNGKIYQTRDIWKDEDKNLAVMKIAGDRLTSLPLADISQVTIGQSAFVVTDPTRAKQGFQEALISDFKSYPGRHKEDGLQYIQIASVTSQINRGALLDRDGKLIGLLITAEKHLNMAAPLQAAEKLAKENKAIPLSKLQDLRYSGEALNLYMKGVLARDAQKWDEAIEHLKKALELNPNLAGAHLELGYAYYKKRLYDLEAREYAEALRINPTNTYALFALALNLQTRGFYEQAIKAYEKAVAIDPEDAVTLYELGVAYIAEGQKAKAMEVYTKLKKLDEGSAEMLRRLAK